MNDALMSAEKMGMDKEMHFYFLPGGEMIEDGSRLLGTGRMEKIIEVLAEKMDYVILDSAPVGMLTDAGVLAQFADSVVFVSEKRLCKSGSYSGRNGRTDRQQGTSDRRNIEWSIEIYGYQKSMD